MQTILGGNGTIGSVLAKELTVYTKEIRLVSRNPRKVNSTDEIYPCDVSDPLQLEKAIEGSEVVYLLIGFDYNLQVWRDKWPKLMRSAIDACIRHKSKLVFFDNVYMYDVVEIPHMTENSAVNPPSKKGEVRKEIAELVMREVKSGRLTALIARSADFYGPKNEKSFLNEMVYRYLKRGKRPMWPMDADKKHSFTFTPDAAKATALLGNTVDAYNQIWHLPTDKNALTGREMTALFANKMDVKARLFVLPIWLFRILGLFVPLMKEMPEMMYQYDRDYIFDSAKFDKRFEFSTTTYEEGIRMTIEQSQG